LIIGEVEYQNYSQDKEKIKRIEAILRATDKDAVNYKIVDKDFSK